MGNDELKNKSKKIIKDKAELDYLFPSTFEKLLPGTVIENELVKMVILQLFVFVAACILLWSDFERAGVAVLAFCGYLAVRCRTRVNSVLSKRHSDQ